ncbi:MAG: sulfite exporter TauE/SafE family protein [Thermomicrobiales bacterium]|nr:sulfite exporter TauE/SafE family protein [Thermomicrobiales bacterium]
MGTEQTLMVGLAAAVAATLGSMLGLGGGVFMVPLFTLYLGVEPALAVGATAVAVVANSVVGSRKHLGNGFVNVRLALLLEITAIIGAVTGAVIATRIRADYLKILLGIVLIYAAVSMFMNRRDQHRQVDDSTPDPWDLMARYTDPASNQIITYMPEKVPLGMAVGTFAGLLSGLLGIGGGIVKGPTMDVVMKMPLKASAGTATMMVGITGVATALVFYRSGNIDLQVAVPAVLGVFLGSSLGAHLTSRINASKLVVLFFAILTFLGISMIWSGIGA